MKVKMFNRISDEARTIRKEVFMDEQGFENEFDGIDEKAIHIVMYQKKNLWQYAGFFGQAVESAL